MKFALINKAKTAVIAKSSAGWLLTKKHSPEILIATGCVSVVTGTVMACKATRKIDGILEERRGDIEKIDNLYAEESQKENGGEYSKEDAAHDKFITNVQTAVKVGKKYLPAASVMIFGLVCILSSYKIMKKRNVAITAAYNALKASYDKYRARVREKYGDDEDRNLLFGIEDAKKKLDEMTEEEKKNAAENPKDAPWYSDYAKFFDPASPKWDRNHEYNKSFLLHQQSIFNEKLNRKGHVFLNEVYDALGIPRTQAGQVVGWIKNGDGNGFIDFGIFDQNTEAARRAINGYEDVWLLDFNVDGVIYDKIGAKI